MSKHLLNTFDNVNMILHWRLCPGNEAPLRLVGDKHTWWAAVQAPQTADLQ